MPINNDNQARQAAELAQRIGPDHEQFEPLMEQIRTYASNRAPGGVQAGPETTPPPAQTDPSGNELEPQADEQGGITPAIQMQLEQMEVARRQALSDANPDKAAELQRQMGIIRDEAAGKNRGLLATIGRGVHAVGDLGLTAVTAMGSEIVGGLAGAMYLAKNGLSDDSLNTAVNIINGTREKFTAEINTEGAQAAIETIAPVVAAYEGAAEWAATNASFGNPEAATAIYTGIMAAPDLLGLKGTRIARAATSPAQTARQIRQGGLNAAGRSAEEIRMLQFVRDHGLPDSAVDWRTPVIQAARRIAPESRATEVQALVDGMRTARDTSRTRMNQAFTRARQRDAYMRTGNIQQWVAGVRDDLVGVRGMDLSLMPETTKIMEDLRRINRQSPLGQHGLNSRAPAGRGRVHMNEMQAMRQRLNDAIKDADGRDLRGLTEVKKSMDNFMDSEFTRRMIDGDQAAIKDWRDAGTLAAEHGRRFDDVKEVRNLINMEATPAQVRNWILGASDNLPPAQVEAVVDTVVDVAGGVATPEVQALRTEVMRGLLEPLLKDAAPDDIPWQAFLDGVNRMEVRNPGLLPKLGFDMTQLEPLRRSVRAFQRTGGEGFWAQMNPYAIVSRFSVGHGMAKRSQLVRTMTAGLRSMTGAMFGNRRRAFWSQMMDGVDQRPMINRTGSGAAALYTTMAMRDLGLPSDPDVVEELMMRSQSALTQQSLMEQGDISPVGDPQADINRLAPNAVPKPGGLIEQLTGSSNDVRSRHSGMGDEGFRRISEIERVVNPQTGAIKRVETIGHGITRSAVDDAMTQRVLGKSVDEVFNGEITPVESRKLTAAVVARQETERLKHPEWSQIWPRLTPQAKDALRNMHFNMGPSQVARKFPAMMRALKKNPPDYAEAARQMLVGKDDSTPSVWSQQVGARATRLAAQLREAGPQQES